MNCDELLKTLNEYVDGVLEPGICKEFEQHLAGCNPCQVVVDNIRKTISLYKQGQVYEVPLAFKQRLRTALKEKWRSRQQ